MAQIFPATPSRLWVQPNDTDVFRAYKNIPGNLFSSFNLDIDEVEGNVRVGKRLIVNTNSADVSQLNGVPVGFRELNGKIYTAAGAGGTGYVFNTSTNALTATPFSKNTVSGGVTAPSTVDSLYSDIDVLSGQLFVTMKDLNFYYMSQNSDTAWATGSFAGGGADNNPHMLTTFAQRMYCTYNGNKIISWDNSSTPVVASPGDAATLDMTARLAGSSVITFIRAAANRIWIGTVNQKGGKGYVYAWNGATNDVQNSYRLDSAGALSCVIKDDVPYITDVYGNLLSWNGGTFVKLAGLNLLNMNVLFNPLGAGNNRFIHPNGMSIIRGKIHTLLDLRNYDGAYGASGSFPDSFTISHHLPSGIWQFDQDTGSYTHAYSFGLSHASDTIVDYGQFYLASTSTTGAVGGLSEFLVAPGGAGQDGSFLCGGGFSNDASSSGGNNWAIFYDNLADTKQKAGYLVTMKVESEGVTDIWQKMFIIHKALLAATDKIVLKYKTTDAGSTLAVVTCPTTSTFTTTADLSAVLVGDEVEFISGKNGGICTHITALNLSGGSWTVTVDETLSTSGGATSRVFIQRWVKASPTINDQTSMYNEIGLGPRSTWIQFKMWMLFTGKNEVLAMKLANTVHRKIE